MQEKKTAWKLNQTCTIKSSFDNQRGKSCFLFIFYTKAANPITCFCASQDLFFSHIMYTFNGSFFLYMGQPLNQFFNSHGNHLFFFQKKMTLTWGYSKCLANIACVINNRISPSYGKIT